MRLFSDVHCAIEDPSLRRAHELAMRGLGRTSPNPCVGCVIVDGTGVVAEGWHERAGGPHAEVIALRAAGKRSKGATVYVTLEPCSHHGKTPPCTDALIAAGVERVVIGMRDPSDAAAGGAELLQAAGIDVTFADDPSPFESLNEGWLKELRTGLPWVTAKVALSLDSKLSRASGVRTAISGPGSASVTMRVRSRADAVLVGAATASIDDPSLTVRDAEGNTAPNQPLRVILCRSTVPTQASLLNDGLGEAALLLPRSAPDSSREPAPGQGAGDADIITYEEGGGLRAAFAALAERGVRRVLVEPGGRLMTALLDAEMIDELVLIHAGGLAGVTAPGIYMGEGEGTDVTLERSMTAREASIVQGDAVTVWRSRDRREKAIDEEERVD